MGNTLSIRLPEELLERLRQKAKRTGLPVGRLIRQYVESGLSQEAATSGDQVWRKYLGIIKGGPRDVSTRKGFSRE
jgi:predicted transcriptional regulator